MEYTVISLEIDKNITQLKVLKLFSFHPLFCKLKSFELASICSDFTYYKSILSLLFPGLRIYDHYGNSGFTLMIKSNTMRNFFVMYKQLRFCGNKKYVDMSIDIANDIYELCSTYNNSQNDGYLTWRNLSTCPENVHLNIYTFTSLPHDRLDFDFFMMLEYKLRIGHAISQKIYKEVEMLGNQIN